MSADVKAVVCAPAVVLMAAIAARTPNVVKRLRVMVFPRGGGEVSVTGRRSDRPEYLACSNGRKRVHDLFQRRHAQRYASSAGAGALNRERNSLCRLWLCLLRGDVDVALGQQPRDGAATIAAAFESPAF